MRELWATRTIDFSDKSRVFDGSRIRLMSSSTTNGIAFNNANQSDRDWLIESILARSSKCRPFWKMTWQKRIDASDSLKTSTVFATIVHKISKPLLLYSFTIVFLCSSPSSKPLTVDSRVRTMMMRRRRSPVDNATSVAPESTQEDASTRVAKKAAKDSTLNSPLEHTEDVEPRHSLETNNSNKNVSFRVAKFMILRSLGFVFLIAFLGAFFQNQGLMGTHGLVPAEPYMAHLQTTFSSPWQGFLSHPTLFWWIPLNDITLNLVAIMGIVLSVLVMLGLNSWICMVVLWLLDFSIVTLAESNSFYSYGWESQVQYARIDSLISIYLYENLLTISR